MAGGVGGLFAPWCGPCLGPLQLQLSLGVCRDSFVQSVYKTAGCCSRPAQVSLRSVNSLDAYAPVFGACVSYLWFRNLYLYTLHILRACARACAGVLIGIVLCASGSLQKVSVLRCA